MALKPLPDNIDAEQAVLSYMMIYPEALGRGVELLKSTDFVRPAHATIFKVLSEHYEKDVPTDPFSVCETIDRRGWSAKIGDDDRDVREYITSLDMRTALHDDVDPNSFDNYAEFIVDASERRATIHAMHEVILAAQDLNNDKYKDLMADKAIALAERRNSGITPIPDAVNTALTRIESYGKPTGVKPIPYGISNLDRLVYGSKPGELTIIGGRPSNGKTVLLVQHALKGLYGGDKPYVFSLEMSTDELIERIIYMEASVNGHIAKTGELQEQDFARIAKVCGDLWDRELLIDDRMHTISQLVSTAKQAIMKHGVNLILVDYLQLIDASKSYDSVDRETESLIKPLKKLAKDCHVPVVVASQLNRSKEHTSDKEPTLAALRNGGNQEAHCDKAILVHNRPEDSTDWDGKRASKLIVAKHRNGPTGEARTWFHTAYAKFFDMSEMEADVIDNKDELAKPNPFGYQPR